MILISTWVGSDFLVVLVDYVVYLVHYIVELEYQLSQVEVFLEALSLGGVYFLLVDVFDCFLGSF